MLKDVVSVQALEGRRLWLRFEDGVEGEVDVDGLVPFRGVFANLGDPAFFAQVGLNRELGTVEWPNGADLDPDVLHARLTGDRLPGLISSLSISETNQPLRPESVSN